MPAIPTLDDPLTDGRVALRLAAERDIPEILIAYQDDPRMHERLGMARPPSGAELGRMAEQADAERQAGRRVALTITEQGSDVCRGQLTVDQVDWEHARAELGIWVAPQMRNHGFARAALRLTAGWVFEACGLARLELRTEHDNEPMMRAAQAAGFVDGAMTPSDR